MIHRSAKRIAIRTLLAALCLPILQIANASGNARPNIIWLMAEDMGTDLECYGTAGVRTPNLNRLAEEGIRFDRAYCASPICSPNRSSMMVGVHQGEIDAQHHRSNRNAPLPAPYQPITSLLRDAGYTCILGSDLVMQKGTKIDCNFKTEPTGPYDGKTQFGLFDKIGSFEAEDQPFFNQIQLKVTHRGDWWNSIREASTNPVSVDEIQLPPYLADTPEIRYDWAAYLDTVEYMDNEVGLILQELKDKGLDQNTIVIFIADNGRCNLRGKGYLHESGIHVPMIVWGPGYVAAGSVINKLVCTTDISATVLELAGSEIPDYITAKPIFGVPAPKYRDYVRSARDIWDEIDDCSRSIATKRFKYIKNHMSEVPWNTSQAYLELNRPALHVMRRLKTQGVLNDAEMTHFLDEKPSEELYDLQNDPYELNNLALNPEYANVLAEMRALENHWQSQRRDYGLEDLGQRQPEQGLGAGRARDFIKDNYPELWTRLEAGELMETQSWTKMAKRAAKRNSPKK